MARRFRDRARRVATARDNAEATAATRGDSADAQARLEAVTWHLGTLVAAVRRDTGVTPWGTRRQQFPTAARALGDIVVALGTSAEGHEEVARRLEVALMALGGQG
ncbi:hypothetical protein TURU_001317 [Turdus rufiventris]|nr:hypothetical protein TURU_001317 [Turdus rufiventris]